MHWKHAGIYLHTNSKISEKQHSDFHENFEREGFNTGSFRELIRIKISLLLSEMSLEIVLKMDFINREVKNELNFY